MGEGEAARRDFIPRLFPRLFFYLRPDTVGRLLFVTDLNEIAPVLWYSRGGNVTNGEAPLNRCIVQTVRRYLMNNAFALIL